ncbi:sugar phosphate nucleotidyltransferase [Sphaerobacter thermophilus]|uniref:sugar phosphate nucleotidyltransferase n=1 Tax=Sphaerobacter thermophilus TaxID=2057 RepID=UPI000DB7C855|nr:MAG: nucleotidyltransferase [Sphaerobacter thermophilus]
MNIIIPVAGLGTRLRPQTWSKPKPLVSVAGKPVLGHVLDRLLALPIDKVVFVTGYLGDQIEDYVRQNYRFDATFVEQKEQLGQSHAIIQARGEVTGPTLVVFPDMLFEADLEQISGLTADGALFVKEVDDPRRFGVIEVENGRITRLVEKPETMVSNLAIVGIYYFRAVEDLFDAIDYQMAHNIQTKGEYFLADAIQHMIDQGTHFTYLPVTVWEDCGNPKALLNTNRYLLARLGNHVPDIPGAVIVPPVVIDPTATIRNAVIGPYASIGARVTIDNSIVTDSIVDEGAEIETVMLTRSIVGRDAFVRGYFMQVNVGDSSDITLAGGNHTEGAQPRD